MKITKKTWPNRLLVAGLTLGLLLSLASCGNSSTSTASAGIPKVSVKCGGQACIK